jgi:hypothetical protein
LPAAASFGVRPSGPSTMATPRADSSAPMWRVEPGSAVVEIDVDHPGPHGLD